MDSNARGVRTFFLGLAIVSVALFSNLMGKGHPSSTVGDKAPPASTEPSIRLWERDAPGAQGSAEIDIPTLTPFFPPKGTATGAAFIVCPGGAYMHLAPHEGKPIAEWLNSVGITSFVLKYRLGPKYHHPVELEDVQRAIRLVRSRAAEWNLDPKRIGIIGFSAGGHLASSAATHFDDGDPKAPDAIDHSSSRPDLAILIYPVITMYDPYEHHNSRNNLLGDNPDPALVELLSSDRQVTPNTPPCFLVHGADDRTVAVENSLLFAMACHKNKVPFELHVLEHGPHGFGLGGNDPRINIWPGMATRWLQKHGFAKE
jgi:acetyl esterase/lipase